MQQCKNCGAKLPIHARFCGACGQLQDASADLLTDPSGASGTDFRSINFPTGQSSQTYPASMNVEQAPQELDVPVRNIVPENGPTVQSSLSEYPDSDNHQALWPDLLITMDGRATDTSRKRTECTKYATTWWCSNRRRHSSNAKYSSCWSSFFAESSPFICYTSARSFMERAGSTRATDTWNTSSYFTTAPSATATKAAFGGTPYAPSA